MDIGEIKEIGERVIEVPQVSPQHAPQPAPEPAKRERVKEPAD